MSARLPSVELVSSWSNDLLSAVCACRLSLLNSASPHISNRMPRLRVSSSVIAFNSCEDGEIYRVVPRSSGDSKKGLRRPLITSRWSVISRSPLNSDMSRFVSSVFNSDIGTTNCG